MKSPNTLIVPTLVIGLATGCSGGSEGTSPEASASAVSATSSSASIGALSIRFTDLGGGSPYVNVYADPSESGRGTETGGYNSDEVRGIACYKVGREVLSAAGAKIGSPQDLGEDPLRSNVWYLLTAKLEGKGAYAPDTYADVVPKGAVVPPCDASATATPVVVATTPR